MLLQALNELYDRLEQDPAYQIAPPGYSLQKIGFCVVLKPDGTLVDIADLRDFTSSKPIPKQIRVPEGDKSTGGVTKKSVHQKVRLLRNDLPFLLGANIVETEDEKGKKKRTVVPSSGLEFEAFKARHLSLECEVNDDEFSAVCRFLKGWKIEKVIEYQKLIEFKDLQGVFSLAGKPHYVHESEVFKNWYCREKCKAEDEDEYITQCLVTGRSLPIAKLHEPKIKKVGIASGAPIVAFDKDSDAYCSYGMDGKQGYNAPVSKDAAFKYATAINNLVDGPKSSKHMAKLADATLVFWTEAPTVDEDVFSQFIANGWVGDEEANAGQDEALMQRMRIFVSALKKGGRSASGINEHEGTRYFLLALTGQAKGRIGIRFFEQHTLGHLRNVLSRHYEEMRIQKEHHARYGKIIPEENPEFISAVLLLDQTCPKKKGKPDRDKIPPLLSGQLLSSIIQGKSYPRTLYSAVLRRIQAERQINYVRASIIKAVLNRNHHKEVSVSLDVNRLDPAYRLGRMFAVLEKTQTDALPDLNATIRERFYSAASATPRAVFPRLLRTYQHHLAKLEGGRKVNREKLMQQVMESLQTFPAQLNLEDQGLFAIGYYHQSQDLDHSHKVAEAATANND